MRESITASRGGTIDNLQVLRFVAALAVIVAHAFDIAVGLSLPEKVVNFGAIGVDIFFVISGFIIARTGFSGRRRAAMTFAWNRIRRVVPLYYLLSLPWITIALGEGRHWIRPLIATITFWPAVGLRLVNPLLQVGWTLCFEMLFYAAATAALAFRTGRTLCFLSVAYVVCWSLRVATGIPAFRFLANPIVLEFCFGILIALTAHRIGQRTGAIAIVLGLAAMIASVVFGYGRISEAQFTLDGTLALQRVVIWGIPSALVVLGGVTTAPWSAGPFGRELVRLGDASYALYLVHPLWLYGLAQAVGMVPPALLFVAAVAGALIAGTAVHRLIELPLLRRLGASGEKGAGQRSP